LQQVTGMLKELGATICAITPQPPHASRPLIEKEIQAVRTSGPGALFQLALDPTERFLYVIGQRGSNGAPGNTLHVLAVDGEDGTLTEVPSSPVPVTVQSPDARPQGIAVF
jgi:hypothetical protein